MSSPLIKWQKAFWKNDSRSCGLNWKARLLLRNTHSTRQENGDSILSTWRRKQQLSWREALENTHDTPPRLGISRIAKNITLQRPLDITFSDCRGTGSNLTN